MITMLKEWTGAVEHKGIQYPDINAFISGYKPRKKIDIKLLSKTKKVEGTPFITENGITGTVQVTVKKYMTQKSTPEFKFMAERNNDIPMPLCVMVGTIEKETRGMYYMKLHGDIIGDKVFTCMKCGRALHNPVSQYFGIGPECGGHNYTHPFDSDEELKQAVNDYKKELQSLIWEGWVIKSAIKEVTPV